MISNRVLNTACWLAGSASMAMAQEYNETQTQDSTSVSVSNLFYLIVVSGVIGLTANLIGCATQILVIYRHHQEGHLTFTSRKDSGSDMVPLKRMSVSDSLEKINQDVYSNTEHSFAHKN